MGINNENMSRRRFAKLSVTGLAAASLALLGGCASSRSASSSAASASASAASSSRSASSSASAASASASAAAAQEPGKALVVVFSWSGNTYKVAERIAQNTGLDVFRIEPATPYTTDYNEMLTIAQNEQSANAFPEIAERVDDWGTYSNIYLGFPTWWGHLPQIVKSFLAQHDCTGKTLYPFNTHAGSGFANCLDDLAAACPQATIETGLSLLGENVDSSGSQIDTWVASHA